MLMSKLDHISQIYIIFHKSILVLVPSIDNILIKGLPKIVLSLQETLLGCKSEMPGN
jgi:hypothetical protein